MTNESEYRAAGYGPNHPFGPPRRCPTRSCLNTYTPLRACRSCGADTESVAERLRRGGVPEGGEVA